MWRYNRILSALAALIAAVTLAAQCVIPRPLKPGDRVAVLSPASHTQASREKIAEALEAWGYEAVFYPNTFTHRGTYSADASGRASDFNRALNDPTIRAIIATRGGYGSAHLFDLLDADALRRDPKWIVGFSDISALHAWAIANGVAAVHGPTAGQVAKYGPAGTGRSDRQRRSVEMLDTLLRTGLQPVITLAPDSRNLAGDVTGELRGGNMIVVNDLSQTPWDMLDFQPEDNVILFFEETDEGMHAIDRMLTRLHQAGILEAARGLIFGQFVGCKGDSDFSSAENLISARLREWGYYDDDTASLGQRPIVFDFPVGHGGSCYPLISGGQVHLKADRNGVTLSPAE